MFWWAKFRKKKGGVKVHTLYDIETQIPTFFHITTASANDTQAICEIPYESGVYYIFDRAYNFFKWLFFKWLKQHLKIKRFWGESENAVRIQIYSAMITYCLAAIVLSDLKIERTTYEVLQILSISLTDKTTLRELLDKTKFQK